MKFDSGEIRKKAKQDFESEWKKTAGLVTGKRTFQFPKKKGKKHLLTVYSDKIRGILLDMGFDEVFLKPLWEDRHVMKQYGPEAPAILDRLYYLAALPRPDIGLSEKKKEQIRKKLKGFKKFDELKSILMDYKRGKIDAGEDFTEALVTRLEIKTEEAHFLINEVFSEMRELKPAASNISLISHATTAWFPTLQALQNKRDMPVMLFSFPWRYRREQREDSTHLRAHYNLTMVVMDRNFTIEDGKYVTKEFFSRIGFEDITFRKKANEPAYYAPGTNYEVFAKDRNGHLEVSEIGMYSPVALANYGITYPVFNCGPGLGRIVMLLEKIRDIREVHFPELYSDIRLTDRQIAESMEFAREPKTPEGEKIAQAILKGIRKYKDSVGVSRNLVYQSKTIKVYVSEPEEGKTLLGPAGLNEIYVYEGSILGVNPGDEKFRDAVKKGIHVASYLDAISRDFASRIESGEKGRFTVKMADTLPSINMELGDVAQHFISSTHRKIQVGGPVFVDVEVEKC